MTYKIARGAQVFGPYAADEVYRLLAAGNIVPTDLAQGEGMQDWRPVGELFPAPLIGTIMLYPDPPNLPWWVALLLGIVTGGLFFVVWDIVEAAWMRRVWERSAALGLYVVVAILYVLRLPEAWHIVAYNAFNGPLVVATPLGKSVGLAGLALASAARFVFRNELLRHFNGPEPLGLRLNAFWTLLFGGLYFQFHFNRINDQKRMLRMSIPAA
jgi:GYF domain 2